MIPAPLHKSITTYPGSLHLIEMLGLVSDFLDPASVEEQFFRLVDELFSFDRVALFFVKHGKGVLQGKMSRGFSGPRPEQLTISLVDGQPLSKTLTCGLPYRPAGAFPPDSAGSLACLDLDNAVFIPITKRNNIPCWTLKQCSDSACPAHGKSWLRCWHIAGTRCSHCKDYPHSSKIDGCTLCPVFSTFERLEGMLLVDNTPSGTPISDEVVAALSVVSQMVALAISQAKRFQKVMASAIRDELTGLYNRRYFNERLMEEIERGRRYGEVVSLISCDIDHFKRVNDTHGHATGDRVLTLLADLLRRSLRKSDVIARYGGEEFLVLLPDTRKQQAWETAEKLRQHVAATEISHEKVRLRITVSCGVASLGEDGDSVEMLLDKADRALYAAKFQGRNQVCLA